MLDFLSWKGPQTKNIVLLHNLWKVRIHSTQISSTQNYDIIIIIYTVTAINTLISPSHFNNMMIILNPTKTKSKTFDHKQKG